MFNRNKVKTLNRGIDVRDKKIEAMKIQIELLNQENSNLRVQLAKQKQVINSVRDSLDDVWNRY